LSVCDSDSGDQDDGHHKKTASDKCGYFGKFLIFLLLSVAAIHGLGDILEISPDTFWQIHLQLLAGMSDKPA
jgi:hypothetical protein